MPELPEVEVIKRGLSPHLVDRKIIMARWSGHKLRLPITASTLNKWLKNVRVNKVSRRAKYILIDLENDVCLIIHLGMTGRLGIFPNKSQSQPHDHIFLALDNGMEVRFNDTRRFGSVQLIEPGATPACLAKLGPEPFADGYSSAYLLGKATNRKQPIKNFLMDSHIVVGIGNIYAAEILFAAGIDPLQQIKNITSKQWQEIIDQSRDILRRAIKAGGTTISDYVKMSGEKGYFQTKLKVYGKSGKPCPICGQPIAKVMLAGRATFYCPGCQKG